MKTELLLDLSNRLLAAFVVREESVLPLSHSWVVKVENLVPLEMQTFLNSFDATEVHELAHRLELDHF